MTPPSSDHSAAALLRRIDDYRRSLNVPAIPVYVHRRSLWQRLRRVPRIWAHCWRFAVGMPMWERVKFCWFNVRLLFRKTPKFSFESWEQVKGRLERSK